MNCDIFVRVKIISWSLVSGNEIYLLNDIDLIFLFKLMSFHSCVYLRRLCKRLAVNKYFSRWHVTIICASSFKISFFSQLTLATVDLWGRRSKEHFPQILVLFHFTIISRNSRFSSQQSFQYYQRKRECAQYCHCTKASRGLLQFASLSLSSQSVSDIVVSMLSFYFYYVVLLAFHSFTCP